nr:alpha/beta hydrolase [Micromonospora sp. DSM 115978]
MTRVLLVPGRGTPLPEHWQRRWSREHPEYHWVRHRVIGTVDLADRVAALTDAVDRSPEPAVLVAHSAGCVTVALWAALPPGPARHPHPVRGALLVTPPDLDRYAGTAAVPDSRLPADVCGRAWPALPTARLSFPSILVASRNDEWMAFDRAVRCASDWGAELVDAGEVGHLDTSSGFGPWPAGERLLERLVTGAVQPDLPGQGPSGT